MIDPTPDELMTIVAARALRGRSTVFVGIGAPSAAANLARQLYEPGLVLIYESGTIGSKPEVLPLSIGDGELAETADTVVSVPEIFFYWLQAGRIDVGFLSAAQIDRFANLNTTVIGPYERPKVRLPGAGGAPEIAAAARDVFIMMKQRRESFVERLDFLTSPGFLSGGDARARSGMTGRGPSRVITDLGVLEPHATTGELVLVQVHPGVDARRVQDATSWPLKVGALRFTESVTSDELSAIRALNERTSRAHAVSHG